MKNKMHIEDLPVNQRPIKHENHKPVITRRDMISRGIVGFSGSVITPSLLTMMENKAYGIECKTAQSETAPVPFLSLDLGGGANFAMGNVIVGKRGGQTDFIDDAGAANLGCPSDQNPLNNPEMAVSLNGNPNGGLLFHANSGFLAGLRSATAETTRANMDGTILCGISRDDSNQNQLNPAFWIQAAGTTGSLIDIIGDNNSPAKGRSQPPQESISTASSARVQSEGDARSLIDPGLLERILPGQAEKVLKAAEKMSAARLAAFKKSSFPDQVRTLVQCGYIKSVENLTGFTADAVDPTADPNVTAALAINNPQGPFQPDNRNDNKVSTIAKLVLEGFAGNGTITLGGYDYHGQGRRTQTIKDFDAGRSAGQAFSIAAAMGKPLCMSIFTDGAVSARDAVDNSPEAAGRFSFTSDSGDRASAFMLVYNPAGVQSTGLRQIGAFQDGNGSVDQEASPVGRDVVTLTKAMVANYLALSGREGDLQKIIGNNPFSDLSKILAFGKLV